MAMTVREVIVSAKSLLAEPHYEDGFFSNEELLLWLNEAVRKTLAKLPIELLGSLVVEETLTVDSTGECELPSDMFKLLSIRCDDADVSIIANRLYYHAYNISKTMMDNVYIGELIGNVIKFNTRVTSDDAYPDEVTIIYIKNPLEYLDLDDELEFKDQVNDILTQYLAAKMAIKDNDYNKYGFLMNEWRSSIRELSRDFGNTIEDSFVMIDPDYRSDWSW